jgi:hypothetical protein
MLLRRVMKIKLPNMRILVHHVDLCLSVNLSASYKISRVAERSFMKYFIGEFYYKFVDSPVLIQIGQ